MNVKTGDTNKQIDCFAELDSIGTTIGNQVAVLKDDGDKQNIVLTDIDNGHVFVSNDPQTENSELTYNHLSEDRTISEEHHTEHSEVTKYNQGNERDTNHPQTEHSEVTKYNQGNERDTNDPKTEHSEVTKYNQGNERDTNHPQTEHREVTKYDQGNERHTNDPQTEYSVVTKYHLQGNDTVTDDPRTEYSVVTNYHQGTDTVTDDPQTEYSVVTKYLQGNDIVTNDPQMDHVAVTCHFCENHTLDDSQTEHSVAIEDSCHEYDTVSNNICIGEYHVTDEGDIALLELFSCIGKSKGKKITPHKFTKENKKERTIDPSQHTELKHLDEIYETGVKPRHPYGQIVRQGNGRSLDMIGGCRMKEYARVPGQLQESKHSNVKAEYEKQASFSSRSVVESCKRQPPNRTSVMPPYSPSHDFDKYDFSFPHRGYAVLIVNKRFRNFSTRDGAQYDVTKSKEILRKLGYYQMNYECKNLGKTSFLKILETAQNLDHSVFDSFALIISSHGDEKENPRKNGQKEHAIYCTDDQYIFTGDILEMFSDDNCPSLKGKPKLFFIQACRGSKTDPGAEIAVTETNDDTTNKEEQVHRTTSGVGQSEGLTSYYDGKNHEGEKEGLEPHLARVQSVDDTDARVTEKRWEDRAITHCFNDCLIMYAIPPGYFAWRSNTDGSWMLHYLWIEVMNYDYRKPFSFLKVLTATSRKMASRETHTPGNEAKSGKKAIPVIIHQLDKDIVFRQKKCNEYTTITFV